MERLPEFDMLKAFALFLLFAYHSSLSSLYPDQMWFVQMYLLAAFFIISGILFRNSLERGKTWKTIAKKMTRVYFPLLIGIFIVFITGMIANTNPIAYFYHATGLSIFKILQEGNLNLFHLWYLVHLMAYFVIFASLFSAAKNARLRTAVVASLFFIMIAANSVNSPLSLEWKFMFFFPIFYLGMELGAKGVLKKTYNKLSSNIAFPLLAAVVMILAMLNNFSVPMANHVAEEFINMTAFMVLKIIFCISSCIISLWLLSKIYSPSLAKASEFATYGMLFAYIIQPIVLYQVSLIVGWLPASLVLSFVVSIIIGYAMQKCYDKAITTHF